MHDLWESLERKLRALKVELDAFKLLEGMGKEGIALVAAFQRGVGRNHGGFVNSTIVNAAICSTHSYKHQISNSES